MTTIMSAFAKLRLTEGRWRPISSKPEFTCQVALAEWRDAGSTAVFALVPNLQEGADVTCRRLSGQDLDVSGPGWTDRITLREDELQIRSDDGEVNYRLGL